MITFGCRTEFLKSWGVALRRPDGAARRPYLANRRIISCDHALSPMRFFVVAALCVAFAGNAAAQTPPTPAAQQRDDAIRREAWHDPHGDSEGVGARHLQIDQVAVAQMGRARRRGRDQQRVVPGEFGHGTRQFLQPRIVGVTPHRSGWGRAGSAGSMRAAAVAARSRPSPKPRRRLARTPFRAPRPPPRIAPGRVVEVFAPGAPRDREPRTGMPSANSASTLERVASLVQRQRLRLLR